MAPRYVLLAAILLASPAVAVAQQEEESAPREAVPRASRPQGDNPTTGTAVRRSNPPPSPAPAPDAGTPRTENRGGAGDRRAVERDRDPRRDTRGGTTVIVPRDRRTVIVRPDVYVYNRYDHPAYRPYPYGYGAFGLGYFYYDPYRWGSTYPGYGYGGGYYSNRPYSSFDVGELRLDVSPRHAQVFVDGYYAGTVDDFDGAFQSLKLASGAYRIEISAPGYETLVFDVRIDPGRDVRYRGELRRY